MTQRPFEDLNLWQRIFAEHWETFAAGYEREQGRMIPEHWQENVERMLLDQGEGRGLRVGPGRCVAWPSMLRRRRSCHRAVDAPCGGLPASDLQATGAADLSEKINKISACNRLATGVAAG